MIISLRYNLLLDSFYTLSNQHLLLLMRCRYLAKKRAAIIHIMVHYYIQPAVPFIWKAGTCPRSCGEIP